MQKLKDDTEGEQTEIKISDDLSIKYKYKNNNSFQKLTKNNFKMFLENFDRD